MVVVVVADDQLLELAVLAHLAPHVLVEGVEVVLQLRGVHAVLGVEGRVLVQVGHQDRLAVGRLDVLARAPVTVAAGADLVVEGAVDLFTFRARASAWTGKLAAALEERLRERGERGRGGNVPCPARFRKYSLGMKPS